MPQVKKIDLKPFNRDQRGSITKILEGEITSVLLIVSKKSAVRANHYHKKDSHYVYMVSGKMRYTSKDLRRKKGRKHSVIFKQGEMIYTPPMIAHAMEFLADSVFLALTTRKRDQKRYENDTVRVKLV